MPSRRLPNNMPAVIRTLKTARDKWKNTPLAADRALTADQWAQLDDTVPGSFLNRLLKEASDVDLALAAQAPLTSGVSQTAARLTQCVSHFHQVLDLGIARGDFAVGARGYYGRDINASAIPDLTTYDNVAEAAENIVSGEAARATAEGPGTPVTFDSGVRFDSGVKFDSTTGGYVAMSNPSAAQVGALLAQYQTLSRQSEQALVNTDTQREELQALYATAQALAVDICDTVEYFYRKDPDASSRRVKCERWGVVYLFDQPAAPAPPPATTPPPTN